MILGFSSLFRLTESLMEAVLVVSSVAAPLVFPFLRLICKLSLTEGDKNEEKEKEIMQEFGKTCDWIKNRLGNKVASVQISTRLSTSPCVIVSGKFGWSPNTERLMKAQSKGDPQHMDFMRGRRVFVINPEHPIIKNLNAACRTSPDDQEAQKAIDLLYDTALMSSGYTPENPSDLSGKIYEMMGLALGGKWQQSDSQASGLQSWTNVDVPGTFASNEAVQQSHGFSSTEGVVHQEPSTGVPSIETIEAEIVEPEQAGGQK